MGIRERELVGRGSQGTKKDSYGTKMSRKSLVISGTGGHKAVLTLSAAPHPALTTPFYRSIEYPPKQILSRGFLPKNLNFYAKFSHIAGPLRTGGQGRGQAGVGRSWGADGRRRPGERRPGRSRGRKTGAAFWRPRERRKDQASSLAVVAMHSSSSCFWSTTSGQDIIRSLAFCTLGKAMTSRMEDAPAFSMHRRSRP